MTARWVAQMLGESSELAPLVPVADAIIARFADGAARPEEVTQLGAFARALQHGQDAAGLELELRALSQAGFLRGTMVVMASLLREQPRADVALMLARELLDAIDVELGARLLHALLSLPTLADDPRVVERANLLLGEHLLETGDPAAALRHFEAVLAADIDHRRALRGWQQATFALEQRGLRQPAAARGLATLDGVAEVELAEAFGLSRYELGRALGRGRHAVVYQAFDRHVGREVAIKRLLDAEVHGGPAAARLVGARFFAEARTLAGVRSPHVVALYDVQPRQRLVALELCRGGNLRQAMRRKQFGPADLPRLAVQLRAALDAVHAAGAVHRDVKPANILVRTTFGDAPVALGDFGLAVGATPGGAGTHAGTLRYLAPELRRGHGAASIASDRFSTGVVLLELALHPTGLPDAFDRLDDELDADAHVPEDLPGPWAATLRSLLARDPDARRW